MKFVVALCLICSSFLAFSASERAIYDVMYLPNAGGSYGMSDFGYLRTASADGYLFQQTAGHSFTDYLSVEGSLGLAQYDYRNSSHNQEGFSDPSITGRYRALDKDFMIDLLAGGIMSFDNHKIKNNGESNNLRGGGSLYLGTEIGQKMETFQWNFSGRYQRNLEAKTNDSNGVDYTDDAHNSWELGGEVLTKLSEKSFLRGHANVFFVDEYEDDQNFEVKSSTVVYVGPEYQHLMSRDFLLKAGVDYINVSQMSSAYKFSNWRFGIGANYQF